MDTVDMNKWAKTDLVIPNDKNLHLQGSKCSHPCLNHHYYHASVPLNRGPHPGFGGGCG